MLLHAIAKAFGFEPAVKVKEIPGEQDLLGRLSPECTDVELLEASALIGQIISNEFFYDEKGDPVRPSALSASEWTYLIRLTALDSLARHQLETRREEYARTSD